MENGLLWVAVFVLLISNLCLALKIRHVEKRIKFIQPPAPEKGDPFFSIITQQINESGRHLEEEMLLRQQQLDKETLLRQQQQQHESTLRADRARWEAQRRLEQERWEAERRRHQPPRTEDDPQGAGVVA